MIGYFNCQITGVRLQLYRMISENKAANAPIRIEEFVMVMIIKEIDFLHTEIRA